jgi:hypothetical protein
MLEERQVPPTSVALYTSSTHFRGPLAEGEERRIRHILNTKRVDYEVKFIDLNRLDSDELQTVSGNRTTPQLLLSIHHKISKQVMTTLSLRELDAGECNPQGSSRKLALSYDRIQELEDCGQLDTLLLHVHQLTESECANKKLEPVMPASDWERLYLERVSDLNQLALVFDPFVFTGKPPNKNQRSCVCDR